MIFKRAQDTEKKAQNKRLRNSIVSLALLLLVVLVVLLLVLGGGRLSFQGILDTLTFGRSRPQTGQFQYTSGADSVYATLDGGLAIVSRDGVQVFDAAGEETVSQPVTLENPAMETCNGRAVAFDLGGSALRVFDGEELLLSLETENPIISASLNDDGWLALATQETAYKASVTVYNPQGTAVYKWYSGGGYVLDAQVSPDNRGLAALVLTDTGSAVAFFRLDSEEEQARFVLDGTVALDIRYMEVGTVSVVTQNAVYFCGADGAQKAVYDLGGQYIASWCQEVEGVLYLLTSDSQVGAAWTLTAVNAAGEATASLALDGKPLGISAAGERVALLFSDRVRVYDKALLQTAEYTGISAVNAALLRADGSVLAAGAYSAVVLQND